MLAQPFVNYNLAHGCYLTSSPIITGEVKRDQRWTVPVGGGKIAHFGPLPVNVYAQFFGNAVYSDRTTDCVQVPNAVSPPYELKPDSDSDERG